MDLQRQTLGNDRWFVNYDAYGNWICPNGY